MADGDQPDRLQHDNPKSGSGPGPEFTPDFSEARLQWRQRVDLTEYDSRWQRLEAQGISVHRTLD